MNPIDLSKVHKSVLECNLSYWSTIKNKALQELQVAQAELDKIQYEILRRKELQNDN